jgi:SSS family solute:Na+ symporter
VLFGAILSSFNSALHSASTLFGLDIYKTMLRPGATDREIVRAGKIFGGVLALLAMSMAPLIMHAPEGLFTLMKKIGAVINVPILAVVFMGVFTTRVKAQPARIALFSGMVFYVVFSWLMGDRAFGVEIHWLHSVGLNFLFMCGLMWGLSHLRAFGNGPEAEPLRPAATGWWSRARPIGAILVAAVFALYTFLHHLGS